MISKRLSFPLQVFIFSLSLSFVTILIPFHHSCCPFHPPSLTHTLSCCHPPSLLLSRPSSSTAAAFLHLCYRLLSFSFLGFSFSSSAIMAVALHCLNFLPFDVDLSQLILSPLLIFFFLKRREKNTPKRCPPDVIKTMTSDTDHALQGCNRREA